MIMKQIHVLCGIILVLTSISCSADNTNNSDETDLNHSYSSTEEKDSQSEEEDDAEVSNRFITCYVNGEDSDKYIEFPIKAGGELDVITEQKTYLGYVQFKPPQTYDFYKFRYESETGVDPPTEFKNDFITIIQKDEYTYKVQVAPNYDLDYIHTLIHFYPLEDFSYTFGMVQFVCQ